jgi:hypothetical protein
VKCGVDSGLGFGAYAPAQWIIQGYEAIDMLCTGLIEGKAQRDVLAQSCVVNRMFGLAARGVDSREFSRNQIVFATSLLE